VGAVPANAARDKVCAGQAREETIRSTRGAEPVWDEVWQRLSAGCQNVVTSTTRFGECLGEFLAQFAAQNLTGSRLGDGADEVDLPRLLVMCETLGDEAAEFVR
jgi:hypothetical protein